MPRSKSLSPEAALDTLPELFLRRGYDALAIREIGTALGVSRSTVYGTFGTKPELFASVLRRYGPARAPGLRELRDAPSPRAALVRVFEPAIAAGAAQRCLVLDMIVKMPDSSPAVAGLVKAAVDDLQARFGAAIERGRAGGEIAAGVDPFQAAGALLGLYLGLYVLVHSGVASESVLAAVARQAQALLPPPAQQMSRAKQFAVDDVLAKAVHRFSTHGYHDTSIRDLEQCMGIHRTSMYGAFGSKRGLFVSALRYHIERYGGALRAVVERESSPAAAIGGVFAGAIENGGFIIGTAVELAAHDDEIERIVAAVWRAVEYLFGTLIEEGQSAGEIAASVDPIEAGRALVGLYLGLGVHVLSGEPASGVVMQQVQAVLPAPGRR